MASKSKKSPRLASGRKRARQDTKLNAHNSSLRSRYCIWANSAVAWALSPAATAFSTFLIAVR